MVQIVDLGERLDLELCGPMKQSPQLLKCVLAKKEPEPVEPVQPTRRP